MMMTEETWLLYVLRCSDGTLYTGVTNNLERRIRSHNSGKGAKYTRSRCPCLILSYSSLKTKSFCLKSEIRFKKLSRDKKLGYVTSGLDRFFSDFCVDLLPKNLDEKHYTSKSDRN